MDIVPKDPALTQFFSENEFREASKTFHELAESGKSLTRLPRKPVDRQRVLEALHEAFELVGGVPRLSMWAHENYGDFVKLFAKTAPSALQVDGNMNFSMLRPALPPSALDQDFTEAEFSEAEPSSE